MDLPFRAHLVKLRHNLIHRGQFGGRFFSHLLGRRLLGRVLLRLFSVDCSGLVYLGYRTQGLELPRDARDQFRKSAKIRRAQLRAGDLVFLTKPYPKPDIYHVMVYAGNDSLTESRDKEGTIRTTFQERFGMPLSKIESGDLVPNLLGNKPAKVRIDFGSFLHQ